MFVVVISDSSQAGRVASANLGGVASELAEPGTWKLHACFAVSRKSRNLKTVGRDI